MPEIYFYSGFSVSSYRCLDCDIGKKNPTVMLCLATLLPSIDDELQNELCILI